MNRSVRAILVIAAIQVALLGAYFWVERGRASHRRTEAAFSTAPARRADGLMPALALRAHDGTRHQLGDVDRATLVHFWATWCPPCLRELPSLLSLPQKAPVDVVAIALDEDWSKVEQFFEERPPATVFLADPNAAAAFDIRTLPVTYLVEPERQLRFRFDGARDWGDPDFLRTLATNIEHD